MSIYRRLVIEEPRFVGAVRDRHDVDVLEFRTGFTPVTMGQDVMPADFAAGLDLAPGGHRPMKQCIETRDANAGLRRFYVFEERGKAADNFARAQTFGDPVNFIQAHTRFFRARRPWIRTNFFRLEFAFECEQDVPLVFVKIDHLHPNHLRRLVCFLSGLDRFSTNMSDAERENSFRRHDPEFLGADFLGEQFAMFLQGKPARHFQRRPKFVFGAGADRIRRTNDNVTRKWIALKHPIKRAIDLFCRNFPGDECAVGEVGREQCLPDATDRSGAEHRRDARHHKIDPHARAARDFLERLPDKACDFVLRNGEDPGVDRIVMLDWQHSI